MVDLMIRVVKRTRNKNVNFVPKNMTDIPESLKFVSRDIYFEGLILVREYVPVHNICFKV